MLEFILFLKKIDKEILDLVHNANFSVQENANICKYGNKFFGFLDKKNKRVVICTHNAKIMGGYYMPNNNPRDTYTHTHMHIRRALRHEATHVAQMCNGGEVLNMIERSKMRLHPVKQEALTGSTKVSGNKDKEFEAYWMEDRPKKVRDALRKYCL